MTPAFQPGMINKLHLKNRFVRSATWEGLATEEGAATPRLIETMIALAEGGVGLIVSGHAYVDPVGQASPWQLAMDRDELIPALLQMTEAVHACGGRIVAQLAHAGHFAPEALTRRPPLAVSIFEGLAATPRREISLQEIGHLVEAFAAAARRAQQAGFDGVQIHSAHGYLLSQFLSPFYNRRSDAYGGALPNRARIHLEILQAIRSAVGRDYPVLIKMNCEDFAEQGLPQDDARQAAILLEQAGLDAIELSGGLLTGGKLSPSRPGINREDREAYFAEPALALKKEIRIPLILVGGMRSLTRAEQLLTDKVADFIAMSRPLIREPDLVRRWQAGDLRRAECRSDNLCFRPALEGRGIACVTREAKEQKRNGV